MRYGALVLWTCWVFQPAQGRRNIRPPHFASKVSYSASPQTFAECSRNAATAMPFGSKPHKGFPGIDIINLVCPCALRQSHLLAAASSITLGRG